jgi:hypothetical protein
MKCVYSFSNALVSGGISKPNADGAAVCFKILQYKRACASLCLCYCRVSTLRVQQVGARERSEKMCISLWPVWYATRNAWGWSGFNANAECAAGNINMKPDELLHATCCTVDFAKLSWELDSGKLYAVSLCLASFLCFRNYFLCPIFKIT